MNSRTVDRRTLARMGAAYGLGAGIWACGAKVPARTSRGQTSGDEDVSPGEDLMREHAVLNRVLLIYEEVVRRLDAPEPPPMSALAGAAGIVRRFIEDYHEKLEEDFLFPRFEKANTLVDLVGVLRRQHQAGRVLTERIQRLAATTGPVSPDARNELGARLRAFVGMYRPHESREGSVLFPALHRVVSRAELDELGDHFESEEHSRFGKEGFEGVVEQVASLERELGIYDLDRFTPT